jgi:hypothetical protein
MVETAPAPDATLTRELTRCKLVVHRNQVHEYVVSEASRAAVDDLIALLDAALRITPDTVVHPTLINTAVGMPPINYAMTQMRVLVKRYPGRPRGRLAVLIPTNPLVNVLDIFLRPVMQVRFFAPQQRDTALEWLGRK